MNPHLRFDWGFLIRHLPDFGPAILFALEIFAVSLALAFLWGILLAVARLSRGPLRWISTAYVEFYRNTPLLLQLYFVFFGLPAAGLPLSPFASGVLALVAQHGAFFAEVLRGAIQSIGGTQREAALALGLTPRRAMQLVVLPQAIRDAIPALGNELVLLVQDTSMISTIGIVEITLQGYILAERSAASFEMFLAVGAIYLLLSTVLSVGSRTLEQVYRVVR